MENQNYNWIKNLLANKQLEEFDTGFGKYLRASAPAKLSLSAENISFLVKEYDAGMEKGGLFFASQKIINGFPFFNVEKIRFVKNVSPYRHRQYKADPQEFADAISYALKNNLLPFQFHSHPTKSENIVFESLLYQRQLDTSDADKIASLYPFNVENMKIRIPEILIVGNGRIKNGIFVGLYGGLVAPLDFTEQKNVRMNNFLTENFERLKNYFNTPERQFGGAVAACVIIFLLIKYPKAIFPTTLGLASLVPSLAYSSTDTNEFFGISNGTELEILIPKIDAEIIRRDEKIILDLKAKRDTDA